MCSCTTALRLLILPNTLLNDSTLLNSVSSPSSISCTSVPNATCREGSSSQVHCQLSAAVSGLCTDAGQNHVAVAYQLPAAMLCITSMSWVLKHPAWEAVSGPKERLPSPIPSAHA